MRIASLILSSTPFVVMMGFLTAFFTAQGLEGFVFLFAALFSCAILMIFSLVALLLAFLRTENNKLDLPARVVSIISTVIFVPLGVFGILTFISIQAQYSEFSQYM